MARDAPAWAWSKIAQYYDDPRQAPLGHALVPHLVFAKRAALGEGLRWTAFRWGYYAGSQAGIFSSTASSPKCRRGMTRPPSSRVSRKPDRQSLPRFVLWADGP